MRLAGAGREREMSAIARALSVADRAVDGVHRIASALERIARATEAQSGTASPAPTTRGKRKPPVLRQVSDEEIANAEAIARASGFKVLR